MRGDDRDRRPRWAQGTVNTYDPRAPYADSKGMVAKPTSNLAKRGRPAIAGEGASPRCIVVRTDDEMMPQHPCSTSPRSDDAEVFLILRTGLQGRAAMPTGLPGLTVGRKARQSSGTL